MRFIVSILTMTCFGMMLLAGTGRQTETKLIEPAFFIAAPASQSKTAHDPSELKAWMMLEGRQISFTTAGMLIGGPDQMTGHHGKQNLGNRIQSFGRHDQQRRAVPKLENKTATRVNYLKGPRQQWQQQLETFKTIAYEGLWQDTNLRYDATLKGVVAKLELGARAQLDDIVMTTAGHLTLTPEGDLEVSLHGQKQLIAKPKAFEEGVEREAFFVLLDNHAYSYSVDRSSKTSKLLITNEITWTTFTDLRGRGSVVFSEVAEDSNGNLITASAVSTGVNPGSPGLYDPTYNGNNDILITAYQGNGAHLWSTYLGGSGEDIVNDIKLNATNEIYISGWTDSTDFPTSAGAFDQTYAAGQDAFITQLSADGTTLQASTLMGGNGNETGYRMAFDTSGNIVLYGDTDSTDLPTTVGAYKTTSTDMDSLFVMKIDPDLETLDFLTYLGTDDGNEYPGGLGLDGSNHIYVSGAGSSNYEVTPGVFGDTYGTHGFAFLTKLDKTGAGLIYSTFMGTTTGHATALLVEDSGSVVVTGSSNDPGLPTHVGAYADTHSGGLDFYLARVNSDATALTHATYLGGDRTDYPQKMRFDDSGNIVVVGYTESTDFPTTAGVHGETHFGGFDAIVVKMSSDLSSLPFSSYVGTSGIEYGQSVLVNSKNQILVLGATAGSAGFPVTMGDASDNTGTFFDSFMVLFDDSDEALEFALLQKGQEQETLVDMTTDSNGNIYLTGHTIGSSFPITGGAYSAASAGQDMFVSKYSGDGTQLLYSTIIGGSESDEVFAIDVDDSGAIFLGGRTESIDFPTTAGAFIEDLEQTHGTDGFVLKLLPDGTNLDYSTFLGGTNLDYVRALKVADNGELVAAGQTKSTNFPTTPNAIRRVSELTDGFITRLNATGSDIQYSTLYGGNGTDTIHDVQLDSEERVVALGTTTSGDFPVTPSALYFGPDPVDPNNGFLLSLDTTQSSVVYASYLHDFITSFAAINTQDEILVLSHTESPVFLTTAGAFQETIGGGFDLALLKFSAAGDWLFGTYLGGTDSEAARGIGVDDQGFIHIAGLIDGIFMEGADQETDGQIGGEDPFYAILHADGTRVDYTTQFGTDASESNIHFQLDEMDNAIFAGMTSRTMTTTPGAYSDQPFAREVSFITQITCAVPEVTLDSNAVNVCPGEAVTISMSAAGTGDLVYRWYKNGFFFAEHNAPGLTLLGVVPALAGVYEVEVVGRCGVQTSEPFTLAVGGTMTLSPTAQAWGSNGVSYEVTRQCDIIDANVIWETTPVVPFDTDGDTLTLTQAPPESLEISIRYEDKTNTYATASGLLLVSTNTMFDDWNDDGCNDITDLHEASQEWRESTNDDANGDGVIDVLDLLYVQINPAACP